MSAGSSAYDIMRLQEQAELDRYIRPVGAEYIRNLEKIEAGPLRKLLRKTGFIDAAWYASQTDSDLPPDEHYAKHGIYEGLRPNRYFDPHWYAGRYQDDIRGEPTAWFIQHGWKRFHDPSRAFSVYNYLQQYPDVARAGMNPLLHFLRAPASEHRKISTAVSPVPVAANNWPELQHIVAHIHDEEHPDRAAIEALNAHSVPVDIVFMHDWGGGVETRFRDGVKARLKEGCATLAIRYLRDGLARLEFWSGQHSQRWPDVPVSELPEMFNLIDHRRFIYASAVANSNAHETPEFILQCACRDSDDIELRVHDYFMISPSYTLQGSDGVYRGLPAAETCDPAHIYRGANGKTLTLAEWQQRWGRLIERADKIVAESDAVVALMTQAYPRSQAKIAMYPATEVSGVLPVQPALKGGLHIGVLGNMVQHKGAAVLQDLSAALPDGVVLTLLGELDPAYSLSAACNIHGRYKPEDISLLATVYGINCWLIPSVWPETYCFTAYEALATGLPVFSFDLGGQAIAAARAANGFIIPGGGESVYPGRERVLGMMQDVCLGGA